MSAPIIIVGAGQAGLKVAETLRRLGVGDEIVMIGEEPHPPYQRPPLSKRFLKGEIASEQLWLQAREFFDKNDIHLVMGSRAQAIERDRGRVVLDDGTAWPYAKLVLATGSSSRPLPIAGSDLRGVHALRTIADVMKLRVELEQARRVTIIGGGYIGLEVAAVLAESGKAVTILEGQDRLLKRVAGEAISQFYLDLHRAHDVDVRLGAGVREIVGAASVTGVALIDGTVVAADVVLVAIGSVANDELARSCGLACQDGIIVDSTGATGVPEIFAAGDCARFHSRLYGRSIRLESVQNANDQARVVAERLAGQVVHYDPVPWFWSDQFDKKLQIAGLGQGYDRAEVSGDPAAGTFSVSYWLGNKLLAVDAVNDARAHMTARRRLAEQVAAAAA